MKYTILRKGNLKHAVLPDAINTKEPVHAVKGYSVKEKPVVLARRCPLPKELVKQFRQQTLAIR